MLRRFCLLLLFLFVILLTVCACSEQKHSLSFFAMDTLNDLTIYGPNGEQAAQAVRDEVGALEKLFSITDPESELSKLNTAGGKPVKLSSESAILIARAVHLSELTEGAFDVTIGAVTTLWGFTGGHPAIPDPGELEEALSTVSSRHIRLDGTACRLAPGTWLDFGGAGKGYAADRAAEILRENGVSSAIVSLGGNVYVLGTKPDGAAYNVGIKDPLGTLPWVGYVSVSDTSVVTAGGYERYFTTDGREYSHIMNPKTGFPAESGLLSATVICENSLTADMLSTAFYVMGEAKTLDFYSAHRELAFEVVLITDDRRIVVSNGIRDRFTFAGADGGYRYEP